MDKPNSEFSGADLSGALNNFDRLIGERYKPVYAHIFKTLQAGLSKPGENPASQAWRPRARPTTAACPEKMFV